jgi:hypothetical protein
MKHIKTTLEGITVALGYSNTLNAVERVLQRGQSSQPPMAYVLEGDDDSNQGPIFGADSLLSRTLNVGVVLVVQQDEDTDARSASEAMNSLIADVQTAMQVDYSRGGRAVNTEELSISPVQIEEGQPILSATVAYRITYRHRRTDPTISG